MLGHRVNRGIRSKLSIGVRVQKELVGNRVVPGPDTWVYDCRTYQCCTHFGSERLREGKQREMGARSIIPVQSEVASN